ncbi:MAG: HAD family hydrolase [Oligoflexia bacterium]|nr:HAD family hydrolase [Oligoflexia bacterium]
MKFDALIFDLDGTLWDCSQASANAFNHAYEQFGLSKRVTKAFIESISGQPSSECDKILLSEAPSALHTELSRCFDKFEIAAIREHAARALYPGVAAGLESLRRHYKLFVVSNCGAPYLEVFHGHSAIGNHFSDSECFGRTQKLKHENICAIVARQRLSQPCYIGDTAGDEKAAALAGLPFFHAGYGFGKPTGSPRTFARFEELTHYFLTLAHASSGS